MREWLICCVLLALAACADTPARQDAAVQRLYVFNCGESTVDDISRWTPGVNAGKPGAFSANCYLIQHAKGYMMWDSGINDSVASMPGGFQRSKVSPRYILRKPLRAQLAEIGVDPGRSATSLFRIRTAITSATETSLPEERFTSSRRNTTRLSARRP